MLLAEELALVAIKPGSGRHQVGRDSNLNACLAGLLVGELILEGAAGPGDRDDRIVVVPGRAAPEPPALAAALEVLAERGPKLRAVLSHMSRGLAVRLGLSTWDGVLSGLEAAGVVGPLGAGLLGKRPVLNPSVRDRIVERLRFAARSEGPIDPRTALVLSMTGPADLLEVVAPERSGRPHARNRIDHALDGSDLEPVGKVVRRLILDAAA